MRYHVTATVTFEGGGLSREDWLLVRAAVANDTSHGIENAERLRLCDALALMAAQARKGD